MYTFSFVYHCCCTYYPIDTYIPCEFIELKFWFRLFQITTSEAGEKMRNLLNTPVDLEYSSRTPRQVPFVPLGWGNLGLQGTFFRPDEAPTLPGYHPP
jgi:hypothetical protein